MGSDCMTRLTFVLLETVKSGRVNSHHVLAESVDLPGNGPPEDLVEHGVRHVVVAPTPPVFRDSKRMLWNHVSLDQMQVQKRRMTDRVRSCSGPRHRKSPEVRYLQSLGDVDPAHRGRRLDE